MRNNDAYMHGLQNSYIVIYTYIYIIIPLPTFIMCTCVGSGVTYYIDQLNIINLPQTQIQCTAHTGSEVHMYRYIRTSICVPVHTRIYTYINMSSIVNIYVHTSNVCLYIHVCI